MGKARKRNVGKDSQRSKSENEETPKPIKTPSKPTGGSTGIVIVLLVMIGVTWGIAATAYFEVVDYKALVGFLKRDTKDIVPPPVDSPVKSEEQKKYPDVEPQKQATESEKPKTEEAKTKSEGSKPKDQKPKPDTGKKTKSSDVKKDKTKAKTKKTITSEADKVILDQLKEGEKLLKSGKAEQAWKFFKKLAENNPDSPRAIFGRARAEDAVAEVQRSNPMLARSIESYEETANHPNCPLELRKRALMALSDKQGFLGRMKPALQTQLKLTEMFPKDVEVLNKLGVRYLMLGQNKPARRVYAQVLQIKPDDGFALVHMGFIMKNAGEWLESIPFLRRGLESEAPGTQEGKFYFHLGDALHRTNQTKESEETYERAAKKGLFKSKYQRSLYNVDRLKAQPYWTAEQAGVKDYVSRLEMNWKVIRDEALAVMDSKTGLFLHEEESLKDTGEWKQFTIYARGAKDHGNCQRTPKTCSIIERMPNAKGCRRGQVKFSVMMPGTHVWRHTGPTNCRLRMHLGLVIPKTGSGARLACAGEMRTWEEGKVLIFDDSFEHEVWQEAESFRLILIVDIWHPGLTEHEKKTLTAI